MISALDDQNKLNNNPIITMFHTDTFKGTIAAKAVKHILENHFQAKVKLKQILDVDVENRVKLSKSLGYFLSEVSNSLLEGEPSSTCFAPIGGFKVWTSLGYLIGAFHQYPTAYLHENSSVLHEIPPVKIQVNEDFIEENNQFFRKIYREEMIEFNSLTAAERKIVEDEPTFFTVEGDIIELNPFGRFICGQSKFAHYFQSSVAIDESILSWLEKRYKSYIPYVMNEINDLIIRHRDFSTDYRSVLFHESDFKVLNNKTLECHLYKGGNGPVFRALWHYDSKNDYYYIGKIWFDHDDYEQQAPSYCEAFRVDNTNWIDITNRVYKIKN